jgi:hypothetical protein
MVWPGSRRSWNPGKKGELEYDLQGDDTLEEIEKIRIERDYQGNFAKKLKLK